MTKFQKFSLGKGPQRLKWIIPLLSALDWYIYSQFDQQAPNGNLVHSIAILTIVLGVLFVMFGGLLFAIISSLLSLPKEYTLVVEAIPTDDKAYPAGLYYHQYRLYKDDEEVLVGNTSTRESIHMNSCQFGALEDEVRKRIQKIRLEESNEQIMDKNISMKSYVGHHAKRMELEEQNRQLQAHIDKLEKEVGIETYAP